MQKRPVVLFFLAMFALALLPACESTYTTNELLPEVLDNAFPDFQKHSLETEKQIFSIDEDMIAFVKKNVANKVTEKGKLKKLAHAIFDRTELSLSYRAGANTTAKETFYGGTANCLSLTIMTYSMTQYLGLASTFQDVDIPEYWTRRNGNTLINRHINLKVQPRRMLQDLWPKAPIIVDFDPQQGMQKFSAKTISKSQMVSLFYANKGADYLINDNPSVAYAYLRASVKQDPNNEGAWLNLGVLASQQNLHKQAQSYYEKAISLRPNFSSAYENLALLYARQGEDKKAQVLLSRLYNKRAKNPYFHMIQGDIAVETHAYKQAIEHYKKAIALNHRPHEFHFSIAKAYFQLGDVENTHRYLKNAKRRAGDIELSAQYASKISTLLASR